MQRFKLDFDIDEMVNAKIDLHDVVLLNHIYRACKTPRTPKNEYGYIFINHTYLIKKLKCLGVLSERVISRKINDLIDSGFLLCMIVKKRKEGTKKYYKETEKLELLFDDVYDEEAEEINDNEKIKTIVEEVVKQVEDIKTKKEKAIPQELIDIITAYTQDSKLQFLLIEHLKIKAKIKNAAMTKLGIENSLKSLDKLSSCEYNKKIELVNAAIESGWITFYPLKTNNYNNKNISKKEEKPEEMSDFDKMLYNLGRV